MLSLENPVRGEFGNLGEIRLQQSRIPIQANPIRKRTGD